MLGGLDVFLPYVRDYVNTFIGKSITTEQWKSHLYGYFEKNHNDKVKVLDTVDWEVSILVDYGAFDSFSDRDFSSGVVLRRGARASHKNGI
jgi:hypothetical protein